MEYRRFKDTIVARIDKGEEILEKIKDIALNEKFGKNISITYYDDESENKQFRLIELEKE